MQASPAATTHFIHDIFGNVIAETAGSGPTGANGTTREYIWLPETEIAPTMGSRTQVDRPLGVVSAANTASPALYYVHVDHLNRPIMMTDGTKASVWAATWLPWGSPYTITGTATLDARFPGQWFQLETGLHYNWHRHYDPSVGRYTQPDPLGFVDGPSVYGYARDSPQSAVDHHGRQISVPAPVPPGPISACFSNPACLAGLAIIGAITYCIPEVQRCAAVRRGCTSECATIYADDPNSLPGTGTNYQPRIRRCITDCVKASGC